MGSWDIVDHPKSDRVMRVQFVLKRKLGKEGDVYKHKTCLVVFEYQNIDYQEDPFYPVGYYFKIMLLCFF